MDNFFAELKRRHIYRVAASYVVVAWVVIQLVNNVTPMLNLPNAVGTAVLVLLAAGFPIALIFAWVLQLASADSTATRTASGKLDWLFIGALLAVLAAFSYEQLSPMREAVPARNEESTVTSARSAAASEASAISLAVLPFENLSSDADQGYFSDGMTEEITTALAKIPDLGVVARQSAFAFKGKDQDVRAVGKALNATHLIEGSVRKAGEQLRISVQLVRAIDGRTMWANSYDRESKDVFAVQEDIARSIATSLNMQLGLAPGENLVSDRSIDPETYQQYLKARAFLRARSADQALDALEAVVARDPNYAPAWALLPEAYLLARAYDGAVLRRESAEDQRRADLIMYGKIEQAARTAIRLDPKLPGGYVGLSIVEERQRRNLVMADSLRRQALALDPNDPDTLDGISQFWWTAGYFKESFGLRERLRLLEPFVPTYELLNGIYMRIASDGETAIRALEKGPADGPVGERRAVFLARAYAEAGQYDKAADALLAMPSNQNRTSKAEAAEAAQLLRRAPGRITENLPDLPNELAFVYAYIGVPDRFLDSAEKRLEQEFSVATNEFWYPHMTPLRKTERFKALVRKAGFVDLWRAKGWPDLCHPTTGDDFACD